LFRVPISGSEKADRVTPAGQVGIHNYQLSQDAKWAIHTYSTFKRPPVIELVSLPDHKVVRTLEDNAELRKRLVTLDLGKSEFFRIDIGHGIELDGWCIKPPDFDASKKYPLLVHVYGEPAGQTVLDHWGAGHQLWHQMLAQQGYVVASVDNRGTPAPRGRAWRKSVYRQIGILASEDQAAALRSIEKKWPFVDPDRVGIWGWSGGGSMTLNMIFRYPSLYRTGISIASVADQRLYDTIYQERYMGLPKENADGFRDGSPLTFAHRLKGNLLIIHGTGDDNCHYQGCERLINALVAADKPFTMMAYPNRSHGIFEGPNTTRHLFELMTRYLNQNLPPGPRD
jgi:dipeptidyl-peptidase-4